MSSVLTPQHFDLAQLKQTWAVRAPSELQQRAVELGQGRFLIEGIFPERSLGLVIGDSGLGKSPLLYQAAICVAAGISFLGHPVRQCRVLYLDYENGIAVTSEMIKRLCAYLGLQSPPEELLTWNLNDADPKFGTEGHTALELLRDFKPGLIVIDSLSSYCPEIEEKNKVAIETFQSLRKVIQDCGSTIVAVHHLRKRPDNPQHAIGSLQTEDLRRWFDHARGASALINTSDVRLGVDIPDVVGASSMGNDTQEIALVIRGFGRVSGEIPHAYVARVFDEHGDPMGYKLLTGASLLFNPEQIAAYAKLPDKFRFKDAQQAYEKGAQATTDFLKKCCGLGIMRKRGGYEKIAPSE